MSSRVERRSYNANEWFVSFNRQITDCNQKTTILRSCLHSKSKKFYFQRHNTRYLFVSANRQRWLSQSGSSTCFWTRWMSNKLQYYTCFSQSAHAQLPLSIIIQCTMRNMSMFFFTHSFYQRAMTRIWISDLQTQQVGLTKTEKKRKEE